MKILFYIFIGGGLGSIFRYLIGLSATALLGSNFPFGTLLANILASLLLGFFASKFLESDMFWKSLIAVGFCGGFSTFSTFSLDTFRLFTEGRAAEALTNIGLNLVCCLAAIYAGIQLAK